MRKIKNTTTGALGTYIGTSAGADGRPLEREHVVFEGSVVTEIDEKKLAECRKDPIVKGWFDSYVLMDQTDAVSEAKASAPPDAKVAPASDAKASK